MRQDIKYENSISVFYLRRAIYVNDLIFFGFTQPIVDAVLNQLFHGLTAILYFKIKRIDDDGLFLFLS